MRVKLSIENRIRKEKPGTKEIIGMTDIFGALSAEKEIADIVDTISNRGTTFSPAVFNAPKRCGENFVEMQLFALDFDTGITFTEVKARADKYRIPIVFAYHTFNSSELLEKFRVVLLHECPVGNRKAAELILNILMKIFPESDQHCKDVARLYCGGKELLYYDESDPSFNIEWLVMQYYAYEYEKESSNVIKRIRNFAKSQNIFVDEKGAMAISRVHNDGIINEINESDSTIYIGGASFSSFQIKLGYRSDIRKSDKNKEKTKKIRVTEGRSIEDICALYKDFKMGNALDHDQRFKLMTNLRFISSGRKDFFTYLPLHTDDVEKWEGYYQYIVRRDYAPQGCLGCPYFDDCEHDINMLRTVTGADRTIIKLKKTEVYNTVEEVYNRIKENIENAICQSREGIYLISAQTAIGKTRAYCNIASERTDLKFIIAVPTNKLKMQVYQDLRLTDDVYMTPSYKELTLPLDIIDEIEAGYRRGRKSSASITIRKFMKENADSDDPKIHIAILHCERYLENRERLERRPRIVVTTHASLLNMQQDIINDYTIIIDEDILMTLFQNMQMVSFDELKESLQNGCVNGVLETRINDLLDMPGGRYGYFEPITGISEDVDCEASGLLEASAYYVDEEKTSVHYFTPKSLLKGRYIVLSATLRTELYKMYFRNQYVYEYPKCESRYMGKLIQYTAHSLSRRDSIDKFEDVLRYAYNVSGTDQIITFKSYTERYKIEYDIDMNDAGLYFGNVAGINKLTGKDIIIIGTPHNNEMVYKLIGKHLGLDVDEALHRRRIEYNGYSFNFTTYRNPALREIQLYYISSELEQAIGRARLLRKSCAVYLFSDFPCDQAELRQEEYLT